MKIITEPHVHLLARPIFYPHPEYDVPDGGNDAENIVAHAGKGCYDSYGKDGRSIEAHIDSLLSSHHGSVLEHVNFTLFITGVSRGLSHELVRHRAGFAFSQRSTRYTSEEDAAIVLDPYYAELHKKFKWGKGPRIIEFPGDDHIEEASMLEEFLGSCASSINAYGRQVKWLTKLNPDNLTGRDLRKWARGKARQLLPHALETRLTVTANMRAWRNFFEQRGSRHAEAEIFRLSNHVYYTILDHADKLLGDTTFFNEEEYETKYRKV